MTDSNTNEIIPTGPKRQPRANNIAGTYSPKKTIWKQGRLNNTERDLRAIQLLKEGHKPLDIYADLGFNSKQALITQVTNVIKRTINHEVNDYRKEMTARLEMMWNAIEAQAFDGDMDALNQGLKIIDRLVNLHGLKIPESVHTQKISIDTGKETVKVTFGQTIPAEKDAAPYIDVPFQAKDETSD